MRRAARQGGWQPHPSRDHQQSACVHGGDPLWAACHVPLKACVMRSWSRKKNALDSSVLVTTAPRLPGGWSVRHYEARPEIAPDDEPRQSGGWQRQKRSATRYSEIVFAIVTVVLSYRLYHLLCNTQAGARFADKTRQALAFEQLRTRRTHVMAYAGGDVAIFETLSCARLILPLPAAAQDQLRHWLDEHLHTVTQRA